MYCVEVTVFVSFLNRAMCSKNTVLSNAFQTELHVVSIVQDVQGVQVLVCVCVFLCMCVKETDAESWWMEGSVS